MNAVVRAVERPQTAAKAALTSPARLLVAAPASRMQRLVEVLQSGGHRQLIFAHDVMQAVAAWRDQAPDAVVLDAALAPQGAAAVLRQVRQQGLGRRVPALVCHRLAAGDSLDRLRREALEAGALGLVGPGDDGSELLLLVRNALACSESERARTHVDALTGLLDRKGFGEHVAWALDDARRYGRIGAVLHIGLERVAQIAEALGPSAGDRLLRNAARRLHDRLNDRLRDRPTLSPQEGALDTPTPPTPEGLPGEDPTLARLADDEFVVLLPTVGSAFVAEAMARRLVAAVAEPMSIDGHEVVVGAKVGISVFPHDGIDSDALLKSAATALRHARQAGQAQCQFYSSDLNARTRRRLGLEAELRHAVERGELELFFQPKADLSSGLLTGAEALVRWNRPEHGMVSPAEFVPLAEETGLIVPLGQWVLDNACRHIRLWQQQGLRVPRIAINASALQLRSPQFVPAMIRTMNEIGIDGSALTLEVTETAVMTHARDTVRLLHVLKGTGARLSIDDFGTGYSSLSYLKRLPVDEIKIDRSFLIEVESAGDGSAIAAAIISMGHSLGFRVVAEGVENDAQLEFLRAHGCDEFQGFLLSQPLPASTFEEVIAGAATGATSQQPSI